MAFQLRNLIVCAYGNGFTLWHYKTGVDTLRDVSGRGYFKDAAEMINGGDMILAVASDGASIRVVGGEDRHNDLVTHSISI